MAQGRLKNPGWRGRAELGRMAIRVVKARLDVFRLAALGDDAGDAGAHRIGRGAGIGGPGRRHRPVRLLRSVAGAGVPGRGLAGHQPAGRAGADHGAAARRVRLRADHAGARHRRPRAALAAAGPVRQDRLPRPGLVRRRAHRRGDAVRGRRRGAAPELLRPVSAATDHSPLRTGRHLPVHGVVGPAGRGRAAGGGPACADRAGRRSIDAASTPASPGPARSRGSGRSCWTRSRACRP